MSMPETGNQSPESKLTRDEATDEVVNDALKQLRTHEEGPDGQKMAYHNERHTEAVIARAEKILDVIQQNQPHLVHEGVIDLIRIAGAGHDRTFDWNRDTKKRNPEESEIQAATETVVAIRNTGHFTPEEIDTVSKAILVTVPSFTPEKGVYQPGLTPEAEIPEYAIALADLGTAGMNPEEFVSDGLRILTEDGPIPPNQEVHDIILGKAEINDENGKRFIQAIISYLNIIQRSFIQTRKANMEAELANNKLDPDTISNIKKQIFGFTEENPEGNFGLSEENINAALKDIDAHENDPSYVLRGCRQFRFPPLTEV